MEKFNPRYGERYPALPAGARGAIALTALAVAHLRRMKSVEDHEASTGRDLQNSFLRPEIAGSIVISGLSES